jgi:hypothetical protein
MDVKWGKDETPMGPRAVTRNVNSAAPGFWVGVRLPGYNRPGMCEAGAGGVNTTGESPPSEKLVRHDLSPLSQQMRQIGRMPSG